ncbi:hypothetical protein PT2222_50025 [Paraburkholderia tropica]
MAKSPQIAGFFCLARQEGLEPPTLGLEVLGSNIYPAIANSIYPLFTTTSSVQLFS